MPKVSAAYMLAKQSEILEATRRCFIRNGVHSTTIQAICAEAGISAGGLYKHFSGKAEIIEKLFLASDEMNREAFGPLLDAAPEEVLPAFSNLMVGLFDAMASPDGAETVRLSLAMHAEAAREPRIAALMQRQLETVTRAFSRGVAAVQQTGGIPETVDPDQVAAMLVALFEGMKPQLALNPGFDPEGFATTVRALLPGLTPPAGDTP